ncbi:MAG: hypothetical protein A2644_03890 [Candidatus Zambryskibacteria bacterium RIFCSPHIGHO2_01_FULL_39_63]|nr:MAG: hypothetical protein UT00_C0003G0033 [Parcubacteria group bacterium GW2011_GWA1_38_7]OHA87342.1 MAG: hypothetical protein A2644_03890 [Candidatus Zambryskibacteria bacterium RIFCSPHIGHO2_01_FULL_39_63]OHA95317.1 MAG: hypothetical protein A3B88_02430 [Candidatus Zambryskibacteria bacterium RIFCSPHIGHO2_02_FULL_39_19]OHA98895.1 MAG: hypothetical protein A3F20_02525 [Candidatus Zambryskibacteria bacterium RIFCSPHIGHO2_12_FULL_39_21]
MIEDYGNEKGLGKEGGFNPEDSRYEQEKLQKEIASSLEEGIHKPNTSYYMFENNEDRNKALDLVEEYRQHDDTFAYLESNFGYDEENPLGIKLPFAKSFENQDEKVQNFFEQHKLKVNKIYRDGENVETKDNLVVLPKNREDLKRQGTDIHKKAA